MRQPIRFGGATQGGMGCSPKGNWERRSLLGETRVEPPALRAQVTEPPYTRSVRTVVWEG